MTFSKSVEVIEELLDSYLALDHLGLQALLNVELNIESTRWL
jgi:hypothetical protein